MGLRNDGEVFGSDNDALNVGWGWQLYAEGLPLLVGGWETPTQICLATRG